MSGKGKLGENTPQYNEFELDDLELINSQDENDDYHNKKNDNHVDENEGEELDNHE